MLPPYSQVSNLPCDASAPNNPQSSNSYMTLSHSFCPIPYSANSLTLKEDFPKKDEKSLAKHKVKICLDCNKKIEDSSSIKHIDVCPEAIIELKVDSNISDDLILFLPRKLSKLQSTSFSNFYSRPRVHKYNIFSSFDAKINYNIIDFSCTRLITDKISLKQKVQSYDKMEIKLNNKKNLTLETGDPSYKNIDSYSDRMASTYTMEIYSYFPSVCKLVCSHAFSPKDLCSFNTAYNNKLILNKSFYDLVEFFSDTGLSKKYTTKYGDSVLWKFSIIKVTH